jgi:hypothetical protein
MAKKHERVPGMRETRPNREQRRHPERPADETLARDVPEPQPNGPQDVSSVRAKNSGHGKKTADKWNQ